MKWLASVPAKLMLLGEYVVLEGGPALVAAVDRRAEISAAMCSGPFMTWNLPQLGLPSLCVKRKDAGALVFPERLSVDERQKLELLKNVWDCYRSEFGASAPMVDLNVDTHRFEESSGKKFGLGSSSAVAVGVTALLRRLGPDVDEPKASLFRAAYNAHATTQRGGSGVDIAACVWGGILSYRRKPDQTVETESLKTALPPCCIVWTGTSASTQSFRQAVERYKEVSSRDYQKAMDAMQQVSDLGIAALKCGNTTEFLEAVRAYEVLLEQFGKAATVDVISDPHREIRHLVRAYGCVYKPSGAGGGDVGIIWGSKQGVLDDAIHEVRAAGYSVVEAGLGAKGYELREIES